MAVENYCSAHSYGLLSLKYLCLKDLKSHGFNFRYLEIYDKKCSLEEHIKLGVRIEIRNKRLLILLSLLILKLMWVPLDDLITNNTKEPF